MPVKSFAPLAAISLAALAFPAQSQPAAPADTADMPRGTYFIYGEEDGAVFVSYEPVLAADNRWPLTFFYYADGGEFTGGVRMNANGECAERAVAAYLTHTLDEAGQATPRPLGEDPAPFHFIAEADGGSSAIVAFVCGDPNARLAQASAPIYSPPALTARRYIALRRAGIGERLARDIAIRDPQTNEALIDTAVPEAQRAAVRAILAAD